MDRYQRQGSSAERLATGLGWFSIALGVAEIAAPRQVARLIGAPVSDRTTSMLRTYGAREIAAGVAILTQPNQARWLWSRVGGDALDLASLGRMLAFDDTDRGRTLFATASALGVTALDILCAVQLGARESIGSAYPGSPHAFVVRQAITVNRPIEEVYAFWHNFENFPRFMAHVQSVSVSGTRSRWVAKAPAGTTVEWDAEIVDDRENELISWRSLEDSDVQHSGRVRFLRAPGARGTEVRVDLAYVPPGGALGRTIAKLFGEAPEQQVRDDLRRVKQILEAGEIPISEGPGLWRPAQPPERPEQARTFAGVRE